MFCRIRRIRNSRGRLSRMSDETKWQIDNEQWMSDIGIDEVGTYAVNVKENTWRHYHELNYTTSWDWLMPIWSKASKEIFGQKELVAKCMATIFDVNIDKTVVNLYSLITAHLKQ